VSIKRSLNSARRLQIGQSQVRIRSFIVKKERRSKH
jgi:hypothetical protein